MFMPKAMLRIIKKILHEVMGHTKNKQIIEIPEDFGSLQHQKQCVNWRFAQLKSRDGVEKLENIPWETWQNRVEPTNNVGQVQISFHSQFNIDA